MSLPLRKRTVHFYEVQVRSVTNAVVTNPSCAPIARLLDAFAQLADRSKLPQTIRKSTTLHTVLADWNYDANANCYELLISRANAALSDVALRDMTTSRLRKAGKTKIEGIEVSAHVLVRPNADGRTAAVLLTMGAGVAPADIESLLRQLSRQAAKLPAHKDLYYFDDPSAATGPDGTRVKYKVRYGFATVAHRGQTLDHALSTGEFEGMELVASESSAFDSGGNLQIIERTLGIKARLPKTVTAAAVRNAVRAHRNNPDGSIYNKLRIHYKTVAGRSTSAVLNVNDLDAAFTLREHIEFDTDVDAQQESLSTAILDKMKPLLALVPQV